MPEVTVSFFGICTHSVPRAGSWRVTLVNTSASVTSGIPILAGIMEHVPQLMLSNRDFAGFAGRLDLFQFLADRVLVNLHGANLQLNSAPGSLVDRTDCMPKLETWLRGVRPGPAVSDDNASLAACHFDFSAGTVEGRAHGSACMAKFTVKTDGPPQLRITPFGGSPTMVFLKDGASIDVSNLPDPEDKDPENMNHFLLHYLSADGFPPGTVVVPKCTCDPADSNWCHHPAETPACSNAKH